MSSVVEVLEICFPLHPLQTGYHVKRNEFEPEYDNDAESIVAELEFG